MSGYEPRSALGQIVNELEENLQVDRFGQIEGAVIARLVVRRIVGTTIIFNHGLRFADSKLNGGFVNLASRLAVLEPLS